jgi:hypothetical protein
MTDSKNRVVFNLERYYNAIDLVSDTSYLVLLIDSTEVYLC